MLSRDEALKLVESHVSKRNWIYHMLAVEAIMRGLAEHFGEDVEEWGLVGLLHDVDFGVTEKEAGRHGLEAEKILRGRVSEKMVKAIKAHNYEHTGVKPESLMEKALISSDALSGLIIASALVMPSRRMEEVTVETLAKKFKQKDFAKGADRERIRLYEIMGVPRDKFFELALDSLKKISQSIGL